MAAAPGGTSGSGGGVEDGVRGTGCANCRDPTASPPAGPQWSRRPATPQMGREGKEGRRGKGSRASWSMVWHRFCARPWVNYPAWDMLLQDPEPRNTRTRTLAPSFF